MKWPLSPSPEPSVAILPFAFLTSAVLDFFQFLNTALHLLLQCSTRCSLFLELCLHLLQLTTYFGSQSGAYFFWDTFLSPLGLGTPYLCPMGLFFFTVAQRILCHTCLFNCLPNIKTASSVKVRIMSVTFIITPGKSVGTPSIFLKGMKNNPHCRVLLWSVLLCHCLEYTITFSLNRRSGGRAWCHGALNNNWCFPVPLRTWGTFGLRTLHANWNSHSALLLAPAQRF